VIVSYANIEQDLHTANWGPTTPLLTVGSAAGVRSPDQAWVNLAKIPAINPDSWWAQVVVKIDTWVVPLSGNGGSQPRGILQVDNGSGTTAWLIQFQQDPLTNLDCALGGQGPRYCPDVNLLVVNSGGTIPSGKVRATASTGATGGILAGLAPPGGGQFVTVLVLYDRIRGTAITANMGGVAQRLSNGFYYPGGNTYVLTSPVSPSLPAGILTRLVFGNTPNEELLLEGAAPTGGSACATGTWENPQTTPRIATACYTVQPGDGLSGEAAGVAAAITASATFNPPGCAQTSTCVTATSGGPAILPQHSGALWVNWTFTPAGGESYFFGGNAGPLYGHILSAKMGSPALQVSDMQQAYRGVSPTTPTTRNLELNTGGNLELNTGGNVLLNSGGN
jgi:hypothetical protein